MAEAEYRENVSSRENVTFVKEELNRRRQSRLVRRGAEVRRILDEVEYRDRPVIIDPGIGFHVRTLRLFVNKIAPGGEDGARRVGSWQKFGHRHTVEAVIYFLNGKGYSIIDGIRYDWKAGDFLCVPVFAWHRHINVGDEPALYLAGVTTPFSMLIGLSVFEDERYPDEWIFAQRGEAAMQSLIPGVVEGITPPAEGEGAEMSQSERLYREEVRFANIEEYKRRQSKVLVRAEEVVLQASPLAKMAYVVDPRLGSNVKVMDTRLLEVPQGQATTLHRHAYEEVCYFLRGQGVSVIGDAMVDWNADDAVFVPPFEWHEHRSQGKEPARILMHTNRPMTENVGLALTQHHPKG